MIQKTTVLFDIGNVIASDYWEAVLLTPKTGICDRLSLDTRKIARIGRNLWRKYAVRHSEEEAYWREFAIASDVELAPEFVREVENDTVRPNPWAREAVEFCRKRRLRVGLMSNNTSFWYPKQLAKSQIAADNFDEDLLFVSCLYGVQKGQGETDLFHRAAEKLDPASTLVIDDRLGNLKSALTRGFHCVDYSRGSRSDINSKGYYDVPDFQSFDALHNVIS